MTYYIQYCKNSLKNEPRVIVHLSAEKPSDEKGQKIVEFKNNLNLMDRTLHLQDKIREFPTTLTVDSTALSNFIKIDKAGKRYLK